MKAMHKAGLSLHQVLAAATINNAEQFKIDDDFGTIEIGKIANLLLLNSNPLESIDAWKNIDIVVLHGEPIDRKTLAVQEQEIP
jgi:imidazolonepropionase-like amidohydrolase